MEGTEDGGDVAVGVAAPDGEQFVGGAESDTAFEGDTQTIDDVSGALGKVAMVRFMTLPSRRKDSRRRTAGESWRWGRCRCTWALCEGYCVSFSSFMSSR